MKRKKKSEPTTVTIQVFIEQGEGKPVVEFDVPIHWYTDLQRMAQARSMSFNEIFAEAIRFGADKMQAELEQKGHIFPRR